MSVTITNPTTAPPPVDVKIPAGGATTGILVKCNGDVNPIQEYEFEAMYLKIVQDGSTLTPEQVVANFDVKIPRADIYGTGLANFNAPWKANSHPNLRAKCNGTVEGHLNRFYAVARSLKYVPSPSGGGIEVNLDPANVQFRGKCIVGENPLMLTESLVQLDMKSVQEPAGLSDRVDVEVADSVNGWLVYRNCTATNPDCGNRLLRHGSPLRARTIQIAIPEVAWTVNLPVIGQGTVRLHQPLGTGATEPCQPSYWRFPNCPTYSIVAHQGVPGLPEYVVASQDIDRPCKLSVDPNQDILLQVNTLSFKQYSTRGGFDVWVRVID